jgi:hypothetical protein
VAKEAAAGAAVGRSTSATPGYAVGGLVLLLSAGAILAQRGVPFAMAGRPPLLKPSYDLLLESVRHSRLERLDRALIAFQLVHGAVPKTLESLVEDGLLDRSYLKDPLGRPFHYALTENGYLLSAVDENNKNAPGSEIERILPPERP